MFKNAIARYVLRCSLVGVAAANSSLLSALPGIAGDDISKAVLIAVGSALAYAGIGAAMPQVEPSVGRKS